MYAEQSGQDFGGGAGVIAQTTPLLSELAKNERRLGL
jgi:hypothetical protein